MLELVFVIVVMGIVAAVLIPRFDNSSHLRDAALQIVSDIRYTQHLAMNDDPISGSDSNWYKKRWTIIFNHDNYTAGKMAYTIFADTSGTSSGNPDATAEIAKNPLDASKLLSGGYSGIGGLDIRNSNSFIGTKRYNIGSAYDIKEVRFSSACSYHLSKRIAFDHLGRPLKGNLSSYSLPYPSAGRIMSSQCQITLIDQNDDNISIYIEPETGYAHL